LSLLALHTASLHLSITREQIHFEDYLKEKELLDNRSRSLEEQGSVCQDVISNRKSSVACTEMPALKHPKLHYVFKKHVKPKKQHEISRMAQV
jgi:hypothetical protein